VPRKMSKEIEPTGIDRRYQKPSVVRLLALSTGGLVWVMIYPFVQQIQIYSTKILGLNPFLVAIFMQIFVIVDILNDILFARLSDKNTKFTRRFGKRFIFFILSFIGMAIFLILLYIPWNIKPGGGLVDPNMEIPALIYIAFIYAIFDCFFTMGEMSDVGYEVDLMRDQETRRRASLIYGIMHMFVGLLIGMLIVPLLLSYFNAYDEYGRAGNPNAFFSVAIVLALLIFAFLPIRAWAVYPPKEMREFTAELDEKVERAPLLQVIKHAFTDRNWVAWMVASLYWAFCSTCATVGISYYVIDGLGLNISMASIPQVGIVLGLSSFAPIGYFLQKKYGARKTYLIGIVITAIAFFLAIFTTGIMDLTLMIFVASAGLGIQNSASAVFMKNALDDSILKHGSRECAQYGAINGAVRSTNTTIQMFVFATIWAIFGYDPTLGTANTVLAKFSLKFNLTIVLGIATVIVGILFYFLYDLTEEKVKENTQKLLEVGR